MELKTSVRPVKVGLIMVKLVILTLGSDGAKVLYSDHEVSVQSNKVDVLDTIAAGDTFNAGFY